MFVKSRVQLIQCSCLARRSAGLDDWPDQTWLERICISHGKNGLFLAQDRNTRRIWLAHFAFFMAACFMSATLFCAEHPCHCRRQAGQRLPGHTGMRTHKIAVLQLHELGHTLVLVHGVVVNDNAPAVDGRLSRWSAQCPPRPRSIRTPTALSTALHTSAEHCVAADAIR